MAEPEITVSITGYQFSIAEIEAFIKDARCIAGMVGDAVVRVESETQTGPGAVQHTLSATTESE